MLHAREYKQIEVDTKNRIPYKFHITPPHLGFNPYDDFVFSTVNQMALTPFSHYQ